MTSKWVRLVRATNKDKADANGLDLFTIPENVFATDSSYRFLRSALYLSEILDKNTPALAALNSIGSIEPF